MDSVMTMTEESIEVTQLEDRWPDSVGEPLALVESEDPMVQAGTYVIEPGERVPVHGTTSHEGPELSIILDGEIVLGSPTMKSEQRVGPATFVKIPAGVEHYSRNDGDSRVKLVYVVLGPM